MARRRPALALTLALAVAAVLAGCRAGEAEEPVPPAPVPTWSVPPTTLNPYAPPSDLPRLLRVVDGYHMFQVSPQQYELIGRRLYQVLRREGLWDQGVRFGANYDPDKQLHFVLIKRGFSQLSARQILNRLLGVY